MMKNLIVMIMLAVLLCAVGAVIAKSHDYTREIYLFPNRKLVGVTVSPNHNIYMTTRPMLDGEKAETYTIHKNSPDNIVYIIHEQR